MGTLTPLSRGAAAALATLGMVDLVTALTADGLPPYARVLLLGTCTVAALTALAIVRRNSYGSRLVAWAVAVLSAAGAVLVGAVGLPGSVPSGLAPADALVLALALVSVAFLVLDVRLRPRCTSDRPPYAL